MRHTTLVSAFLFLIQTLTAQQPPSALGGRAPSPPKAGPVQVHRAVYTGTLTEKKAGFKAALSLECTNKVETVLPLFQGDIAVTAPDLPAGLRLERAAGGYLLAVTQPGEYDVSFDILARITRKDPWRQIEFTGPAATISSVTAEVAGNGMELELLAGTAEPRGAGEKSKVTGALGADRKVALRWQTRVVRQERPALLTVQTVSTVQVTPTLIRYNSVFNYDILQGKPTNVVLRIPANQAITSVKSGAPIRDRRVENADGQQVLTLDFVKPLAGKYSLTLLTEQPVDGANASLLPPEPTGVERERGQVNLQAVDMKVEPGNLAGLRQVNAAANTLGAWQFFGREPFALPVGLQRIEPVLTAHDSVKVFIEEKLVKVTHDIALNVEKAGIYTVAFTPPADWTVASVQGGDGVREWNEVDGQIRLEFGARVLGQRTVRVTLEKMSSELPGTIAIDPLVVEGAQRQTASLAVQPDRGLEVRTDHVNTNGLREAPAAVGLSFNASAAGWKLGLSPRKLPVRLAARVSNGVVIGDNRVYGFSKIFFAISDQGMKEFYVRIPAEWENVQFLGTRKRRELTELNQDANGTDMRDFRLILQDEVWGQYTLQVSYDLQLPEAGQKLRLRGAQPRELKDSELEALERDSGTIIIYSAANHQVGEPENAPDRIDPSELDEHERGRITHPILFAYKYDGKPFEVNLDVGRYREQELLNAVADYAELTTVVTGIGQVATTASLSVKKTDKDNPRFKLPAGAEFISCRVDGNVVIPGEMGEGEYVIPLPEDASRSQVFEVEISYSETKEAFKRDNFMAKLTAGQLDLSGPVTVNIPSTYSKWTVYVPGTHDLYDFEGNMVAPHEEKYSLGTAWAKFTQYLRYLRWGPVIGGLVLLVAVVATLMMSLNKGWRGGLITAGSFVLVAGLFTITASVGSKATSGVADMAFESNDDWGGNEPQSARSYSYDKEDEGETSGEGGRPNSHEFTPEEKSKSAPPAPKKSPTPKPAPAETPTAPPTLTTPNRPGTPGGAGPIDPAAGLDPFTNVDPGRNTDDGGRVTGVLPPEFEIPRDGKAYVFTKALNLSDKGAGEPLKISATIMDRQYHAGRTGVFQWLIALVGLGLLIREWRREERDTRCLTAGVTLLLGGIGAFLVTQGTLHVLLANVPWLLLLLMTAWVIWRFWPAKRVADDPPGDDDDTPAPDEGASTDSGSAAAATAVLALMLGANSLTAGVPAPPAKPTPIESLLKLLADPDALPQPPGGPKVIRESQLQDRNGTWFEINQDTPFTGRVLGFFQNRQKRIESNYQNGRLHGMQSLWFDNGQRRQVTPHEAGLRHGKQRAWFRTGQLATETGYQKGKRHGAHQRWHENGRLAESTPFAAGEPHGLARQWHANGKIAREVRWENGRQIAFDTWTEKGIRFGEGTNTVSLVSANYKLNVHREVAQVEAEFKLNARAPNQNFTLFREVIAVNDFTSSQTGAKLLRQGPALVLTLPEAGAATVKIRFLAKHQGDGTRRTLGFGIPPALTSQVDVVLQEADSDVEMPTAVTFNTSSGGNQTLVDAVIGASDRLELAWKPRVKQAKEIAATVFVRNTSTVSFGNGVIQLRTVLDYTVGQGELTEAKAVVPDGWKLMKVEGGAAMRNYFVATEDGQSVLTAQLDKGVTAKYQLVLSLERTLPGGLGNVPLKLPKVQNVKRETGFVALNSSADLGLTVAQSAGLMKVDVQEFTTQAEQPIVAGSTAYSFNNPAYTLAVDVAAIEAEIEAVARHLTAISDERLTVSTRVEYQVKKVGVFQFRLRLPADPAYRVTNVSGNGSPQWEEKTEGNLRVLVVTLKQRTVGAYPLRVDLVRNVAALPDQVAAEGAHPLGVDKLDNQVGVYAEEGVVVEEMANGKSADLNEMSAARLVDPVVVAANPPAAAVAALSVPRNANALAYRHRDENPGDDRGWSVNVGTRALDSWVRNAQVVNWIHLGRTRLTGRTRVRYEVERAPAGRFTVLLPANMQTNLVRFVGQGIRSREVKPTPLGNLHIINLQGKVRPGQTYLLDINWELPGWNVDQNGTLAFRGPVTQGKNLPPATQRAFADAGMDPLVEGEEGWLVVMDDSRSKLAVEAVQAAGQPAPKNTGDLPEWAKQGSEGAQSVYYYPKPGYRLSLNVSKLNDATVDAAWITKANFTSVVTEDGQMLTRMALEVSNQGRQFLGITLPNESDRVLSVFVNGQARRPTATDKQVMVPLENSSDIGVFPVEVVYTSTVPFKRTRGRVDMQTARFDVKLNNANWWLYLPRDFRYTKFRGSMDYVDNQRMMQRMRTLDTNRDGRLDVRELETDSQFGEVAASGGKPMDLTVVNPNNTRYNDFSRDKYSELEFRNTKKAIDNIARQQKLVQDNLDNNNLQGANRFNRQNAGQLNQLAGALMGNEKNKDDLERINQLLEQQRKQERARVQQQIQQEQYAQQDFATRNFNPNPYYSAGVAGGGQQSSGQGQGQGQGQGLGPGQGGLAFDTEEVERMHRQHEEIERMQARVERSEITPLNINLPQDGMFLAFNQPLQTKIGEPMTISFEVDNVHRTNWLSVILWGALAVALLHFLITAIRAFALRKPMEVEGEE